LSTIKIKLNLVPGDPPGGILPRVRVSQNDNTDRILQFELYDGNAEADLSGISGAYIGGLKPDGNGFTVTCAISGNMATAILSVQSTVLAGDIPCKLYLIYEEGSVRSATFTMQVDPDPLNAADYSETEVPDIINFAREAAERAGESADAAAFSESNAAASATAAANSATAAATSESNASASATAAAESEDNAKDSETAASNSETAAANSATAATNSATSAATSKSDSEAYAIGERNGSAVPSTDPTYHNNSKFYSEVAQQAAAGGLIPQGTVAFANLPPLASANVGDMWNISDGFTTTSDFREGAGEHYGPGADVYKTADGYWDVLADVRVTMTGATATTDGADGECIGPQAGDEDKYWTGAARWESDTSKLITNFTSSDNASETGIITSSGGDTAMSAMTSGDTHGGLFGGLSKAVLNARKLINTVKKIWQTVANAWVSGATYSVGQVVTYTNGHTYICKTAHTSSASITPGNTTYWEDKTIGDMIYSLNSNTLKWLGLNITSSQQIWAQETTVTTQGLTTTIQHNGILYLSYRVGQGSTIVIYKNDYEVSSWFNASTQGTVYGVSSVFTDRFPVKVGDQIVIRREYGSYTWMNGGVLMY
jgi:hypothetical protein